MSARLLRRRSALLLPLVLAACGGAPPEYPTLRYTYLPPIRLNVASISVRQDYVPSGLPPDVSQLDPEQPVDVLRRMAADRLQAFGPAGRAVFVIQNASLLQDGDTITGTFAVRLDIYTSANNRVAYAEARVARSHSGHVDDMHQLLYDMTKGLMDDMNVQFEYQVVHSLGDWVAPVGGGPTPVRQQLLGAPGAAPPPGAVPPPEPLPPSGAPPPPGGPSSSLPPPIPLAPPTPQQP